MADDMDLKPPLSAGAAPHGVYIDPEKLLAAWKANTATQRIIIAKADEQALDNVRVRQDNRRTRWEVRIVGALILLAAVWVVSEQRYTRGVIGEGATQLSRVDKNMASLSGAQISVTEALAKKTEADIRQTPDSAEDALVAVVEAQEQTAKAALDIALTRDEEPPLEVIERLKTARKKRANLRLDEPRGSDVGF